MVLSRTRTSRQDEHIRVNWSKIDISEYFFLHFLKDDTKYNEAKEEIT